MHVGYQNATVIFTVPYTCLNKMPTVVSVEYPYRYSSLNRYFYDTL